MQLTDYHAKYFAYELTKRCPSDSPERFAGALVDAQVDLNPHQVEAALFAFRSPLSRGALLADEVGLGKTIEAGLVLSQKWAERKRRVLVITPSNLRKQWYQELQEKFFLPCRILETRSYNEAIKLGNLRPFEVKDFITICSYQFARNKASDVNATPWDLVVIDEAHRLRNVYKPSNVIANTLKQALKDAPKLLLTATPLQNSLFELFGLVSFIDEHAFGDLKSFREQFAYLNDKQVFHTLKARLKPICQRTLRRQVTSYVSFTRRHPLVQPFTPEESEDRLYNLVSEYLRRDNLQALPSSQRSLMTLVLRKLLASSTFAIAGALDTLSKRLQARLKKQEPQQTLEEEMDQDYEVLDETAEEWAEETPQPEPLSDTDRAALTQEIADLEDFRNLAVSITHNAKGRALLVALDQAFAEADRLGAARKAIVFTESRRTQEYLVRVLADSPYAAGIVLFNGSNNDEKSRQMYTGWLQRHAGTDRVTGSRTADMRSALVDYFREQGRIVIATEAGAEGINLQFCSLVVNYDLPWNPQRIEQRIGRCHRYGQKHDVVVVNFLNQKNEADQRVFQLLSEKFSLFEGVFGASDEVLGANSHRCTSRGNIP
jgi:SNF2 family DNA or RNA helicase